MIEHYQQSGLYIFGDTLAILAAGRITTREAVLRSIVDGFCNPYSKRRENSDEPVRKYVFLSPMFLRRVLGLAERSTNRPERTIILSLKNKGFLKAKKVAAQKWKLATRPRWEATDDYLYVQPNVRRLFEKREITTQEMLILSEIVSFTKHGQLFFANNHYFEKRFGFSKSMGRVTTIIKNLVGKNELAISTMPNSELIDLAMRHAKNNPKKVAHVPIRKMKKLWRVARLLLPVDESFYDERTNSVVPSLSN